jgi:hypothetical protein
MLTYAYDRSRSTRWLASEYNLTYADVCCRLLTYADARQVKIHSLAVATEYNGSLGQLARFEPQTGHWIVKITEPTEKEKQTKKETEVKVRPANLTLADMGMGGEARGRGGGGGESVCDFYATE